MTDGTPSPSTLIYRSVTATRHKIEPELRVCRIMEAGGSLCYMRYVAEVPNVLPDAGKSGVERVEHLDCLRPTPPHQSQPLRRIDITFDFATMSPLRLGFGDALIHLGYLLTGLPLDAGCRRTVEPGHARRTASSEAPARLGSHAVAGRRHCDQAGAIPGTRWGR